MQDLRQLGKYSPGRVCRANTDVAALLRPTVALPRQQRQLPERVLVAAHQACDIGELEVADRLLSVLNTMLIQIVGPPSAPQRRVIEGMVAAYERLWHLRRGIGPAA